MQPKEEPAAVPTDEALALAAAGGDRRAEELLVAKYTRFVHAKARPYFLSGGEREDIFQEGMIGLLEAVRGFSLEKHVSFIAFADLCVTRQILTAVRTSSRKKHQPLNFSVSIDHAAGGGEDSGLLLSIPADGAVCEPETILLQGERRQKLAHLIAEALTPLEQTVFAGYLHGLTYQQIAQAAQCSVKSVDNTLRRAKKKLEARIGGSAEDR